MLRAKLPAGHVWIAWATLEQAEELRAAGKFAEAEGAYLKAVEGLTATLGAGHPDRAAALVRYGGLVAERRGCKAASALLDEGMAALTAGLGPDHPRVRRAREGLPACAGRGGAA